MKAYNTFEIQADYDYLHSKLPSDRQRPIIGITANITDGNVSLLSGYFKSIYEAGGIPIVIPPSDDLTILSNLLDSLDGILLSGGADINPLFLGEDPVRELHNINPYRDRQELMIVKMAADRQIPILGICRGIQVMTAALGGTLYQDIYSQAEGKLIKHSQDLDRAYASHIVNIEEDSTLAGIMGKTVLPVNSFHHQAVKEPAPGFKVCARSNDGIIEAIESTEYKSMLGVQWHPECFILNGDTSMMPIFEWLINESSSFKEAKRLHQRILTLDTHCDTPMFFGQGINFATRDKKIKVDLHKMTEGRQDATIMVAYIPQKERTDEALLAATKWRKWWLKTVRQ